MERKRSKVFRRIFIVAFILFLDPAGGSNPAGHLPNPVKQIIIFT